MLIVRDLAELLFNPFFIALLFFGYFLFLLWLPVHQVKARWGLLMVFILLLISSTGWLPEQLTQRLERKYPVIIKADPSIKWIVILSGGQAEVDNKPSNALLYSASIKRLVEGLRLYQQLPQAKIVLSGGGYGFKKPEAQRLADLASWFQVPKSSLVLETVSFNTADQAYEIKNIVQQMPFYLVSSAIHLPRAMALFKAQGLHPIAAPTDYSLYWENKRWLKTHLPNAHNLFYLSIAMHEILGNIWAKIYLIKKI